MANQEFNHPSQSAGTAEFNPSASRPNPFPEGASPTIDKDTERQAILKQITEGTRDLAPNDAAESELRAQERPAQALGTDPISDPNQSGANLSQAESPYRSTDQVRPDELGAPLQGIASRGREFLMRLGTSLREIPGIDACISLAQSAIEYVVSVFSPPRGVHRGDVAVKAEMVTLTDQYRDGATGIQTTLGHAFDLLDHTSALDSLEASKKLHASIIKAAHELGEAALQEDEREKRAEHERQALEDQEARKAAEAVRAIDNLSGASNGETQSIINKLSGPFAISIEQAISLARDAERREVEQLERHTTEARINSITVPEKPTSSTLAA